jgi:hypothetical protein
MVVSVKSVLLEIGIVTVPDALDAVGTVKINDD